ncbi:lipopolysaccharide biosynthesis protein [Sulfitobacter pontiacus]|uniref:lipopolysaccharide biosynthesis protein n=1 Tax=Sulfitobacter pontiacus TaxID=60137 RepID=UPI0036D90BA4
MDELFRRGFVRSVGILTGGTAIGQAITVLMLPIITRFYSPEDFSLLAVYMALVAVFSVVGCLRYNIAIPLPENDCQGINVLALSLLASTVISLILAIPMLLMASGFAALLGQPGLETLLWMVPVGVWASSMYTGLQYWASRKKRFGLITKTLITRSLGGVSAQLGLGYFGSGAFGLLLGQTLNNSLGVFGLARSTLREDRAAIRQVSLKEMARNLKKFRRYPIYSVPEALCNTAGLQVPILIIASLAVGPEAGFVLLSMRVLGLPIRLIGGSVGQVYLSEAGEKLRQGDLPSFTRRTMATLAKVGIVPILLAGLISPFVFGPVFGDEWARAGVIVAWMTPWFFLQFVVSPVSMVLNVVNRQELAFLLQVVGLLLRVIAVLGAARFAPSMQAEVFAVTSAGFYCLYAFVVLSVSRTVTV